MMGTIETIDRELKAKYEALNEEAKLMLEPYLNKKFRITCDRFNDQPYGSSKRKLKGEIYECNYISFENHHGVLLDSNSLDCSLSITQVEFI